MASNVDVPRRELRRLISFSCRGLSGGGRSTVNMAGVEIGSALLCVQLGGRGEGMKEKKEKTDMWVLSNVACHGGKTTGQNHLRGSQG
jgi:hypothetical protein